MKNAQPRFGLHDDGRLHDYLTGRVIDPAVATVTDADGTWDLPLVVTLINEGKSIESAYRPAALDVAEADKHKFKKKYEWAQGQLDAAAPLPVDKVDQANTDFDKATPAADAKDKVERSNRDFEDQA